MAHGGKNADPGCLFGHSPTNQPFTNPGFQNLPPKIPRLTWLLLTPLQKARFSGKPHSLKIQPSSQAQTGFAPSPMRLWGSGAAAHGPQDVGHLLQIHQLVLALHEVWEHILRPTPEAFGRVGLCFNMLGGVLLETSSG